MDLLSKFLEKSWRLPKPELILSVIGDTESALFTRRMRVVFNSGLASLSRTTQMWVITDGLDTPSGVAALVGHSMDSSLNRAVPVIGVPPFRSVEGFESLSGCRGGTRSYMADTPLGSRRQLQSAMPGSAADSVPLNIYHSVYAAASNPADPGSRRICVDA
eukprot:6191258-Prymnesium_polylepis.2